MGTLYTRASQKGNSLNMNYSVIKALKKEKNQNEEKSIEKRKKFPIDTEKWNLGKKMRILLYAARGWNSYYTSENQK